MCVLQDSTRHTKQTTFCSEVLRRLPVVCHDFLYRLDFSDTGCGEWPQQASFPRHFRKYAVCSLDQQQHILSVACARVARLAHTVARNYLFAVAVSSSS